MHDKDEFAVHTPLFSSKAWCYYWDSIWDETDPHHGFFPQIVRMPTTPGTHASESFLIVDSLLFGTRDGECGHHHSHSQ